MARSSQSHCVPVACIPVGYDKCCVCARDSDTLFSHVHSRCSCCHLHTRSGGGGPAGSSRGSTSSCGYSVPAVVFRGHECSCRRDNTAAAAHRQLSGDLITLENELVTQVRLVLTHLGTAWLSELDFVLTQSGTTDWWSELGHVDPAAVGCRCGVRLLLGQLIV